jgi:hypothetical protein
MSKCDLEIEIEGENRTFRPGDPIKGRLTVRVDADCTCRALTLEAGWKTHGKGNRTSGSGPVDLLDAGEWKTGKEESYPFCLTAPSGPVSYHGHYLNVDWVVRARADIPWAIDPKAEEEFLLLPGSTEQYDFGPAHTDPQEAFRKADSGRGCAIALGALIAVIGLVTFVACSSGGADLWGILVGGILGLVGLAIFIGGLWKGFAQKKIGTPQVSIQPLVVSAGGTLDVGISLQPTKAIKLADVHVGLVGKEVVVKGSGTNRHTFTHKLHEYREPLYGPNRELHPGEPVNLAGQLVLPPDAAPSFAARDNRVVWTVGIHIGIEKWPDWTQTYPVSVLPSDFST